MKHLSRILIAIVLALATAASLPAQVFADALPEYISEVKVYQGSCDAAASEGFKILSDENGKPVDLNQGSGATGVGAKGNKKVYLGYKTTTKRAEAITDLALMNMKGGYSVQEYEVLMEEQLKSQILPFIERFQAAVDEYRENLKSSDAENRKRAEFVRDILDKIIDDDTGSGLGSLLINKTKQELGESAYEKLSDEEKKNHADLATIVAQSNGKIMLVIENLLTRGADTEEDTWLDRFAGMTYESLEEDTGMTPSDAKAELAILYDDAAMQILDKWDDFRTELLDYDKNVKSAQSFDEKEAEEIIQAVEDLDDNTDVKEAGDAVIDFAGWQLDNADFLNRAQSAAIHDALDEINYLDGTMLDFFSKTSAEIEEDITLLYPLAASLSEGQTAGLEFLSLRDLFNIALTTSEGYEDIDLSEIDEISVYDGVDRGIYEKGGVALTSDALRSQSLSGVLERDDSMFSGSTIAMMVITGIAGTYAALKFPVMRLNGIVNQARVGNMTEGFARYMNAHPEIVEYIDNGGGIDRYAEEYAARVAPKTGVAGSLAVGFTVALVILAAVTTYLTYKDLKAHYKVDFTPIPHYIVEEKDIVSYNEIGEKVILKNQSAYYKAVECNRKKGDAFFNEIGTCADMNGAVNPQWLALYSVKKEGMAPILAGSLKAVVGSTDIPAGYTTGIHMFGEDTAFNLNHPLYCWNQSAKSVFVYFKVDTSAPKTASASGSNFTAGNLALAGVAGLAVGSVVTALVSRSLSKKKKSPAA